MTQTPLQAANLRRAAFGLAAYVPLRRGAVLSAGLLLAACGQQPSDLQTMSAALTDSLLQAPQESAAPAVDLQAGPVAAIAQAVQNDPAYLAALAREAETLGRIDLARSARGLQINSNSTLGVINERLNGQDERLQGAAAGINISQLVYDGGESTGAINAATAQALGAQAERRVQGNDLALQAARAWVDVWQFGERLRLLHARMTQMDTLSAQIERMASNGLLDRAAVDSARRQIIDISLEETRLRADYADAQTRFERHFNRPATAVPRPDGLVAGDMLEQAMADWQTAPILQANAAALFAARSGVTSAQAAFRPRARLQGGVVSPIDEDASTDTSVGLLVEYTWGDGGRREAQLTSARAAAQAAEAQLADAQTRLQAALAAGNAQLAAIDRAMPLVSAQISLSATEAQTAQSQIATGQSNLRQLIEAEIQNYRARDRQLAMQAERQIVLLALAAQTGALARSIGLPD